MSSLLDTHCFKEALLRLYLGKYQHQFSYENPGHDSGFVLSTNYPIIVAQLLKNKINLYEYIKIEKDDEYYGAFTFYQINVLTISIEDPNSINKTEKAIARIFLSGAQL